MVASDTVVGLVGAGILLVALVGVFVVESRDSARDLDLSAVSYGLNATGNYHVVPAGGVMVMGVGCVPPGTCGPPRIDLNLTVSNLPALVDGAKLYYVVFATGAQPPLVIGTLGKSGMNYQLLGAHKDAQNAADYKSVQVTLEASANPSAPSTVVLYQKAVSGSGTVDLSGSADARPGSGTSAAVVREGGGGVSAEVTVTGGANHTGFTHRAWLWKGGGAAGEAPAPASYVFLGNFSKSGNATSGTVTGTGTGGLGDYRSVLVTLEADSAPTDKAGGMILFRHDL